MVRLVVLAGLLWAAVSARCDAQQVEFVRAAVAHRPSAAPPADTCTASRAMTVPVGAVAGGALGWVVYLGVWRVVMVGPGGDSRARAAFIGLGAAMGAYYGWTQPGRDLRRCPLPRWRISEGPLDAASAYMRHSRPPYRRTAMMRDAVLYAMIPA